AVFCALGLLIISAPTPARAEVPNDYAYGQPMKPSRSAAAYRVDLPLEVYRYTVRTDLGDLRVFNAEGALVPFSLSKQPPAQSLSHKEPVSIPLFPLPEGAQARIDGVSINIDTAGSALTLQTQRGTTVGTPVRQYLLDARSLDAALSGLQLSWAEGA